MRLLSLCAFVSLSAVLLARAGDSVPSVPEIAGAGYKLVFADEFDGNALDTAKWDYRTDSKRQSTQLPANVSVSGGFLHLNLKKEKAGDKDYTGAGVISKAVFQYGYYESRLRVPAGAGWHTSFWMQRYDGSSTNPALACQELDVVENDSAKPTEYGANVHKWKGEHKWFPKEVKTPDLSAGFHVYGCEFTPQGARYFFDGTLVHAVDMTSFEHGPQNIWLTSIGVGTIDDAKLPASAEYDYVRYYAKDGAKDGAK